MEMKTNYYYTTKTIAVPNKYRSNLLMAKIKKNRDRSSKTPKSRIPSVDELNKSFGGGYFTLDGGADNVERIPSGILDLDKALGGGWPKGRVIELFGAEASGKTWLLIKTYAANQKTGACCLHFDVEQSFSTDFAKLIGLKTDGSFILNQPDVHAEQLFASIIALCESKKADIIGVDSTAALIPRAEMEGELTDERPGLLAKALSKIMKPLANAAAANGVTVILINQVREKIGGFSGFGAGPITYTPGGRALKHFSSVRLEVKKKYCKKTERPDLFRGDRSIGHVMKCRVVKNKTAPPFKTCEADLLYEPKDNMIILIELAIKKGIIEQSKSNYKKITYKEHRTVLPEKQDWDYFASWLKESDLVLPFIEEVEGDLSDVNKYIDSGYITKEKVDLYLKSKTAK